MRLKVTKTDKGRHEWAILLSDNMVVGHIRQYQDWEKAHPRDRIRSKMVPLYDLVWDFDAISQLVMEAKIPKGRYRLYSKRDAVEEARSVLENRGLISKLSCIKGMAVTVEYQGENPSNKPRETGRLSRVTKKHAIVQFQGSLEHYSLTTGHRVAVDLSFWWTIIPKDLKRINDALKVPSL